MSRAARAFSQVTNVTVESDARSARLIQQTVTKISFLRKIQFFKKIFSTFFSYKIEEIEEKRCKKHFFNFFQKRFLKN